MLNTNINYCSSDQTYLTDFSGDKKAWPIYITIGNLPSTIRNTPRNHCTLLLALLPVPPKKAFLTASTIARVNTVIQEALHDVLHPLEALFGTGIEIHCGDGHIQHCFPRLAAWIADHMEYVVLLGLKTTSCPRCEVPFNKLGDNILQALTRDYAAYEEIKNDVEYGTEVEKLHVRRQLRAVEVNGD